MRKFVLLFLFLNFYTVAYNQVIKGTILDSITKKPILAASVYFNRTFVGTSSDQNGKFELDISKYPSMSLIISSIGYNSVAVSNFSTNDRFIIYLIPKVYKLKEVFLNYTISNKKRKSNLKLFKHEFLGTTYNALECKIINENDITFTNSLDKDTIKAFASKPIIIYNKSLGYKVTYFLDKFEYYKKSKSVFFYGNIIFNEDLSSKEKQKDIIEIRRKQTYFGSRMYFFRVLWADNLFSSGFTVNSLKHKNLKYKNLVIENDRKEKFLSYNKKKLEIKYPPDISYIIFLKSNIYFDQNGYFDPSGLIWKGEMAKQRIADWLPYEFSIEK